MRKESQDLRSENSDQNRSKLTPEQTLFLMQCGYINIMSCGIIEKALVLLGNTKAGKTTLLHAMAHSDLVGRANDYGKVVYKVREVKEKLADAIIGDHQRESETQIPNIVDIQIEKQKISIVDLPGFLDTFGCYRSISNRFFIKTLFSKIKNIKFVIVCAFNDLERVAANYVKTIESFFGLFKNKDVNKIEQISKYVSLVITGVPAHVDEKILIKLISSVKMSIQSDQKCYKKLVAELTQKNRVFKFQIANLDKQISQDLNFQLKINSSLPNWWSRDIKQNVNKEVFVDMKEMRVTVSESFNVTQDRTFMDQLKPFSEQIEKMFKENYKDLAHKMIENFIKQAHTDQPIKYGEMFEKLQKNKENQSKQYEYLQKKYKKKRQIYQNRLYNQMMSKKPQSQSSDQNSKELILSLEKLSVFQKLTDICKKINQNADYGIGVQVHVEEFRKILTLFLQLLKKKSQITEKIKQTCFNLLCKLRVIVEIHEIFQTSCQELGFFTQGKVAPVQLNYIISELPKKINQLFVFQSFEYINKCLKYLRSLNLTQIAPKLQVYQKYQKFIQQLHVRIKNLPDPELQQQNIEPEDRQKILKELEQKQSYFSFKVRQSKIYNDGNDKTQNILEELDKTRRQFIEKSYQTSDDEEGEKEKQRYLCNVMKILQLMCYYAKKDNKTDILLEVYEALNDGYNVIQIYKQKESAIGFDIKNQKSKEDMMYLLQKFMQKAFKFGRVELAIEKGQRAYSLAQNLGDPVMIQRISKFLFRISPSFQIQVDQDPRVKKILEDYLNYRQIMEIGITQVEPSNINQLIKK